MDGRSINCGHELLIISLSCIYVRTYVCYYYWTSIAVGTSWAVDFHPAQEHKSSPDIKHQIAAMIGIPDNLLSHTSPP